VILLEKDVLLMHARRATGELRPKKTDVAENPQVFDHVGLLVNEPPGSLGLLFI
jgi:hypothetical protein